MKKKVLFICTHNSALSQMAEGILRTFYGDRYDAYSAGIQPAQVNPYAVEVMAEVGIDISSHHTKHIDVFYGIKFDYVVTICNQAKENCPPFQGGKEYLHSNFTDLSRAVGSEEEKRAFFRLTRNAIKDWIDDAFGGEEKSPVISRMFSRTKKLNCCIDIYVHPLPAENVPSCLQRN